jgi:DNA-binding NarL/FixJ family response regulator
MSLSISSALSTASVAAANSSSTSAAPQRIQQPTNNSAYTVQLTEAQQVYQLYNQGQQIPQIAGSLNLTVSAVNSYLGITSSAG